MKHPALRLLAATSILLLSASCATRTGAGGYDTSLGVYATGRSANSYDLVPTGDRITYTIDISTPEGRQKLHRLSLDDAKRLAETEASRKYNCDRLIDPRFDYLKKGSRILRITVDGRPGVYRVK
ncbi:MAG: hypothetical protein J6M53_08350 [Bacteroidaceae bacterium]|nr:hypothetical protein [Bacteroidaceae bacterium]